MERRDDSVHRRVMNRTLLAAELGHDDVPAANVVRGQVLPGIYDDVQQSTKFD